MRYDHPPAIKYLDFTESEIEEARSINRLLLVDVHMGNRCNLHCPNCYRDAGESLDQELTLEECKGILRQARALGARTLLITGSGEPFLDQKLWPLIEFANRLDLGVVIFTNSTMINEKLAGRLAGWGVAIVAKLNSFRPEIQNFMVGKKNAHRKIYSGLRNLIKVGLNQGCPSRLGIDSVIVKQNYEEILRIFRFCRNSNIVPYITTELPGGRGRANADVLDVTVQEIKKLFFQLRDIDRREYGFDWEPHPPIVAGGSCKKILYQLFIGPTGEMGVCPGIDISLGNIRKISLADALESGLIQKIRHLEKWDHVCPICAGSCTGGCLLSKHSAGDLFGIDPQCSW